MELLYVQTLLDYKHLEPSGQKEGARRHIFDANMPPQFFLPNAEMKASFVFEIRLCHCILQKIRIRFRNQDAALNLTKNPVSNRNGARSQTNQNADINCEMPVTTK